MSAQVPDQLVVAVFGSSQSQPGDEDYEEGKEVGQLLAQSGYAVTNGGYDGLMKAVSQGAAEAGGQVIGVTAPTLFPGRSGGNRFLTDEIAAGSLTERIHLMSEMAAAAIILPGGIGTLTELMIVWNDAVISRLRGQPPRPIVAMGRPWTSLTSQIATTLGADSALVAFVETAAEAVAKTQQLLESARG